MRVQRKSGCRGVIVCPGTTNQPCTQCFLAGGNGTKGFDFGRVYVSEQRYAEFSIKSCKRHIPPVTDGIHPFVVT